MSEHSDTTPSYRETIDAGPRDPEHPHRPVLRWRNKTVENYTITCPRRCGSYKLKLIGCFTTKANGGELVNAAMKCRSCDSQFGLGILKTHNGVMLATD